MPKSAKRRHRMDKLLAPSVRSWEKPSPRHAERMGDDVVVDMGWGRLLFGHTFISTERLVVEACEEGPGKRDIVFYLRDPHVALSLAPQELFLDPSHTYRLWSYNYAPAARRPRAFVVRRLRDANDAESVNHIYAARRMALPGVEFLLERRAARLSIQLVAESAQAARIVATVAGVDHVEAFGDPEGGASLWALAVDPQASLPGVGEALVRNLVEHYFARGRNYVDLSVLHENREAQNLYEKLGFERVPVFCVKHKNPINEPLFTTPGPDDDLNPYARIIADEARRRGIAVGVQDASLGYFSLTFGGRTVHCRESLCELTSAVAMSRCDDKRVTNRMLGDAGLVVPRQVLAGDDQTNAATLEEMGAVVVKPVRGEQGAGVSVDVCEPAQLHAAVAGARRVYPEVLIEEFVEGEDLRIIVIDGAVAAAAVRRPPAVTGTGRHSVETLIRKYSRRRMAATSGESSIPIDDETRRCVHAQDCDLETVLEAGRELVVRKAANLHTGGTIHDVTAELHPALAHAAIAAARVLDMPVVGFDLIVEGPDRPGYTIIEANERPGLANHEPQPTAQRFIDLLFPQTRVPHQAPPGVRP
ncbi:MAG: N-acetylglutaminylglutamine synthetase [Candidatus Krumholzibacteria bacterium]|nr:N-acetylglutaminylglutamine synthetase [Candidatus Krumholzibacteria bacterium]